MRFKDFLNDCLKNDEFRNEWKKDFPEYKLEESINESSMLIDEFSISDNEKLKVYWDKNDWYVVEKIYNQGNDLWRTDFKKTFHDELSAKRYFSRAKKKFSVNEGVENNRSKVVSDLLNEPLMKKYMMKSPWLSGSSTYVYPITEWRDDISVYLTTDKRIFDRFIDRFVKEHSDELSDGYFVKNDGSAPAYIQFNKKSSVNESVEDKKIHKFELTDDYFDNIYNLFYVADEYFKNNPDKDEFEFEFDIDEFKKKVPNRDEKKLNDLAWDYYNEMVDLTHYLYPMYSMNNRNKKYGDTKEVAFDKTFYIVKDADYEDEDNHLDESIYDDDYFKAESEIDGWAQSDADYEKKKQYNDFFEEVLDFGISRKYIKDLYDYYIKRYDYWHKEIYESMCKESVGDDASYNWLSEVIDRDVKFHYTDGGYTMQFESEKDYKKAKDLADKHNFKGGKWFDEDLQFCDYHSTRVGMDYED